MAEIKPTPLNDDEREDLVAYLDGELDDEAARAVEAKLNRDPNLRREAEALRQAWDLLDYLPRPMPSPNFTHRTLDRISSLRTMRPASARHWTARHWLAGAGAIVLALLVGYAASRFVPAERYVEAPADLEPLLARDLHVVANLPLYLNVEDIRFLKELDRPELFGEEELPGAAPVAAGPLDDEALLAQWRQEPEQFARLRHNLTVFLALPVDMQERLRQLQRDLQKEDAATRSRLHDLLYRYAAWFQHLPPDERRLIQAATSDRERLRLVERIRERQWLAQLPRADRESIEAAADERTRVALIEQLRREHRGHKQEWLIARRFWGELINNQPLPARLADFPPEVQTFVRDSLMPLLSEEEKARLLNAQGQWPLFPRTLVELADLHPLTIPGPVGWTRWRDLPKNEEKLLRNVLPKVFRDRLQQVEGRWPDFAVELQDMHERQPKRVPAVIPASMKPSRPTEFPPPVMQFITKELMPRLNPEERARLIGAEGQWPLYPRTVMDLARKYGQEVPGTTLPGAPEAWDRYRLRSPTAALPIDPRLSPKILALGTE
jgi:hypothetical protein